MDKNNLPTEPEIIYKLVAVLHGKNEYNRRAIIKTIAMHSMIPGMWLFRLVNLKKTNNVG